MFTPPTQNFIESDSSESVVAPAKKKSRARKTSEKPTRIYSYRILPPENPEHKKLVDEQFWLAHQYRCRLVEIEIELRTRFREVDLDHPLSREAFTAWEEARKQLEDAYTALRAAKSGKAPKQREDEGLRLLFKPLKLACAQAWKAVKAVRALPEVAEHHQPKYLEVRAQAAAARLAARGAFSAKGLMHGTYVRIEQDVARSVDSLGRPPRFERYEGEGSIGRQLPRTRDSSGRLHSVMIEDLYAGKDTRVRMTSLPEGWEQLTRSARRRAAKHFRGQGRQQRHGEGFQEIPARFDGQYIEMQFGWGPAGRPSTWVRFPMTQHRRMPADAEVLWVHVHRWRVGIHYEWRVQFTIESDSFHRPKEPLAHGGTCALDLGWRRIFNEAGEQIGLRVAYLVDEHGHEREIRVPDGLWQKLAKVDSLAQIRSRELDTARNALVAWLADRQLPEWFADFSKGLPQWRAPRKLQRLVDVWQKPERRFVEDDAMLRQLQAWAKQDRHLGSWEAHMRDRAIANRRETWRRVAAELTRTYQTIVVEDGLCSSEGRENQMKIVDIEGWNKLPPEEGDPHEGREQRRQARMAAPGELRMAIGQAAHKTATTVVDVSRAKKSTRTCAWCTHVQAHVDFAASIQVQCEGCGRCWDQDANAARNLLHARGLTSGPVPQVDASALVKEADARPLATGKRRKQKSKAAEGGARTVNDTAR